MIPPAEDPIKKIGITIIQQPHPSMLKLRVTKKKTKIGTHGIRKRYPLSSTHSAGDSAIVKAPTPTGKSKMKEKLITLNNF